jgi:general secretion pathway protein D
MFRISDLRSLAGPLAAVVLCSSLAPAPVYAKTKAGEKLVKQGRIAEAKGDFDVALDLYEKALGTDPSEPAYVLLTQRARFYASQMHVANGKKLRDAGSLEGALAEFSKAMQKDPGSAIAIQEWKRTQEMIDRAKNGGAKNDKKNLSPQQTAQKEADERIGALAAPPELKPISRRIDTLKMNNQPPKVLFETLGKLAGISVVFDPQFGTTGGKVNFNVDLSNSTLDAALDYLCMLTKAFWKPMNENTIFVAEDNVTKRRDYVDDVVKVFYIQNATSVQEFQEIATAVRSVTEIRRVYMYNAQKAILVRGTADAVELAEMLIRDIDKPKAEAVIDILVMEVNSTRMRQLAAAIASGGSAGLNLSVGFAPRPNLAGPGGSTGTSTATGTGTTPTASGTIGLESIGKVDFRDFQVGLPGALLQALASDNTTRILQRPQVRASDGQKVTLKIGDKVPIASGSFTPSLGAVSTTAGTGLISSTQFTFTDVGIILDVTPQIHGTDEVTLKMSVEVSTINSYVTIGGISQPVIGQRKTETELRLREGEVNLLGGLLNTQYSRTMAGLPGLLNIPVLSQILGNETINTTQQDVVIAVIPHIVRTPTYTADNFRTYYAGNETDIKLRNKPVEQDDSALPAKTARVVAPPPVMTQPAQPSAPPPVEPPVVSFSPAGDVETPLSGTVTLNLQVNTKDLFSCDGLKIRYPAGLLRLNDVLQGEMMTREGQKVIFSKDIRNDTGEVSIWLKRLPGEPGVSGQGTILSFVFAAIGKGAGVVQFEEGSLKNSQLQSINFEPAKVGVRIN